MKKLISLLLIVIMLMSMTPMSISFATATAEEFAGGSGTEDDPYLIETKYHLNNVRNHLDASFEMVADIVFADADFARNGSFYNDGKCWSPIGTMSTPFTGIFDGNGFAIKNLKINMFNVESTTYVGLFAYTSGAEFKNLGLINSNIRVTTQTKGANLYAGAISGCYGKMSNCYNTGNITAESKGSDVYAAGLTPEGSIFENCYNTGIIYAKSDKNSYAGGISTDGMDFINCYNTGNIEARQCGGIVCSISYGTLKNCYNTGNIYSTQGSGGIAKSIYMTCVENCYNTGYVYSNSYSGGIVASVISFENDDRFIKNCYNTGSIVASMSVATVSGGIVGQNNYLSISNCYNMGVITATSHFEGYAGAGGIVGVNADGFVTNCYNTAAIRSSSSGAGSNFCGGIVGDSSGEICYCYSVGTTSAASSYKTRVGGIVGSCHANKTFNCFYLNAINNSFQSGDIYNADRLCTNEQLQKQETYIRFDFENVWVFATEGEYHYPMLKTNHKHIFLDACDESCNICDHPRSALHVFGDYKSDGNATCKTDGTKTAKCTLDGCTKTDTITDIGSKDQAEHTYGKYTYNNDATATQDGTKTRICSVCGHKETVTATGTKWENPFTDIKKTDFYYEPVLWAVNNGITSGTGKTTFAPNEACTRGQIATFLWRAAGCPTSKTSKNPFSDVKKSDYYYAAVLWAVGEEITSGTSKTTFSPNDACTRGQIATFLWRASKGKKAGAANPFKDVKKTDYYYAAVLWAVENNITSGTSATTFAPNESCTRGQIATFLYRDHN